MRVIYAHCFQLQLFFSYIHSNQVFTLSFGQKIAFKYINDSYILKSNSQIS